MTITRTEFVAQQLRAIAADAEWGAAGVDRAAELAAILVRAGITDLWALKLVPSRDFVQVPEVVKYETEAVSEVIPAHIEIVDGLAFSYYGKLFGFLGTPEQQENRAILPLMDYGYMLAWSAAGHGQVAYVLRGDKATGHLQIVPIWRSSSDAAEARMWAVTIISFFVFSALPMAGISVGNAIGSAVLPASLTAAYPSLATVVGNVALSAALNGGDVKSAVQNSIIGAVSSGVGDKVGGYAKLFADSDLAGKLASAATAAAIRGDSIRDSVLSTFVGFQAGGDKMTVQHPYFDFEGTAVDFEFGQPGDFAPDDPFGVIPPNAADVFMFNPGDFGDLAPVANFTMPDASGGSVPVLPVDDGTFDFSNVDPFTFSGAENIARFPVDPITNLPTPPAYAPAPTSDAWKPLNVVQSVTAAMMSALSLVKAYRSLDVPQVQPQARRVATDGRVSIITDNGLVQTRDAQGNIRASKPPVGIPQATISGNYAVNNGDGTYTVVSPDGKSQSFRYADDSGGAAGTIAGVPTWAAALGVVGLIFALRRK